MGPTTVTGRALYALARGDADGYEAQRPHIVQDPAGGRVAWDQAYQVFRQLVEIRFAAVDDRREIIQWILPYSRDPGRAFHLPALETEAAIRSVLGERGLIGGIAALDMMNIRLAVIKHLGRDLRLDDSRLSELVVKAEQVVAAAVPIRG